MRTFSLVALLLVMAIGAVSTRSLDAQTEANPSDFTPTYSEYDRWQGSSLGIRIEADADGLFVSKVLPHMHDSVLMVDDRLLEIGPIVLSEALLSEVGQLLSETDPDTEIPVKIIRDGEESTKMVKTYRHEFVDIAAIVERIQKNRIIGKHLKDTNRAGELETIAQRMVSAVQKSKSPRLAQESINQIIDELGISHTAIVPKATYQQLVTNEGGELGLVLRRFDVNGRKGYFAVDFKPGSAAHQCGIRLGDEVAFVNGVRIEDSRRLILAGEEQKYFVFGILADAGEDIRIEHRSTATGPLKSTTLTTTQPVALGDSVAASVDVLEQGERSIGYIRFWNLMSTAAGRELKKNLESTFQDCDALILDLRGRGGTIPAVMSIDRTIGKLEIPVVAITDELTRSAKELLSFRLKNHEHVTVIGERTSGAVTAATFAQLPSGNALMFPVMSSDSLKSYTDGEILEGKGVAPDESVNFFEPFCNGTDQLLQNALQRAVELTQLD